MATAHLIAGLPCSGKTTYSQQLKDEIDGVLFTLDRWLSTAFGPYAVGDVGHVEHYRRMLAARELIWETAAEFLKRGVPVILDDGYFLRADRERVLKRAGELGVPAKIHYIDTAVDVLRSRIEERNAKLPHFNFRIDPSALEAFASVIQVPQSEEGAEVVVVKDFEARPESAAPK